jgi:ATP-binding cassette subfamily F protein uup
VLEESLEEFAGALVLVTHDRYLLDRVSTDILALDGRGGANVYADLSQWERAHEAAQQMESATKKPQQKPPLRVATQEKKRLTWNEQRELEGMEDAIHRAEAEVESLHARVADPAVIADHVKMREAFEKLANAQHEVERLYARWAELDSRNGV